MRKLNMFLVAAILVTFLAHAITGSLQLAGATSDTPEWIAWVCVAFISAHVVVTTILTVQSLYARKRAGAGYFKDNLLFWIRRISGFVILIPLVMHMTIFSASNAYVYRLQAFTTGRLISQILLVAAIALHVITNIRPMMISFGVKGHRAYAFDIIFIMTVLLLLFAISFAIYYVRWAAF